MVSFDQVVSRGCGIDVHQKMVVATISGEGLKNETREFGTFTRSLTELRDWLLENGVTHAAMESTGVYWKPVYHILEPAPIKVWIVNARHIKYVPGHKTSKRDSAWICKLLLAGLLKPSYIPPREQRELRDLTRYRTKLIQQVASEKNRIARVLEDCNIKLSSVVSSTHGVVATKLIDKLCEGQAITMADIDAVYHKRLEASKEDLYEACQGLVDGHLVYFLGMIRRNIASTEESIENLDARIREMLSVYDNVLENLRAIPGLSKKTVEDLVAEIGLDMGAFPTEKHLASWAGMCPGNNESAGKKKRQNHPRQQAGKSGADRGRVGGYPDKEHFLQRQIPQVGGKTGQEKGPDRRRTFDPEVCLPCFGRGGSVPRTGSLLCRRKNGKEAEGVPEKRAGENGIRCPTAQTSGIGTSGHKGRFLLARAANSGDEADHETDPNS